MTGGLRPHNQQRYRCMRPHASPRKARAKGIWGKVGKLIAWAAPPIIAIAAWQTSRDAAESARDAAEIARKALQIQEATSLVNVEPSLEVEAGCPGHI